MAGQNDKPSSDEQQKVRDEQENVARIIKAIYEGLFKRSTFLEHCLRTKQIGLGGTHKSARSEDATAAPSLEEVLRSVDWRKKILTAMYHFIEREFEVKKRPIPKKDDDIKKLVCAYPVEGTLQQPESGRGSGTAKDDATVEAGLQRGAEIRKQIRSFIRQHLVYLLIRMTRNAKTVDYDKDAGKYIEYVDTWRDFVKEELLAWYDATILEILANRKILGSAGLSAFMESLKEARPEEQKRTEEEKKSDAHRARKPVPPARSDSTSVPGATRDIEDWSQRFFGNQDDFFSDVDDQRNWVPARWSLADLLMKSVDDVQQYDLYWHVLDDQTLLFKTITEVLFSGRRIFEWVTDLNKSAPPAGSRGAQPPTQTMRPPVLECAGSDIGELIAQLFEKPPQDDARWFFEPGRVLALLHSRDRILHGKAGRFEADVLNESLNAFIDSCDRIHQEVHASGDPAETSEKGLTGVCEELQRRAKLEKIFWEALASNWTDTPVGAGGAPAPGEEADRRRELIEQCKGQADFFWQTMRDEPGIQLYSNPPRKTDASKEKSSGDGSGNERPWRVVVFGAGIAGLTAAHELAERGFQVVVVEATPAPVLDVDGREPIVQVGGVARTQYARPQSIPPPPPDGTVPDGEVVPGEHGYRLFPSFYSHVFDTMKRTPLLSPAPLTNGEREDPLPGVYPTAFDQLQPTFRQVFAGSKSFVPLSRARPRSLEAFRREYVSLTEGLGFPKRDLARFFFKLVRYLMTCSERRAAEYEDMTLSQFLGGRDFYSPGFFEAICKTPKALVAMNGDQSDARTQLNVYLQLLMNQVLGGAYTDCTLRGPTSLAWFVPWREYLDTLDVRFVCGRLLRISAETAELSGCAEDETCFINIVLDRARICEDPANEAGRRAIRQRARDFDRASRNIEDADRNWVDWMKNVAEDVESVRKYSDAPFAEPENLEAKRAAANAATDIKDKLGDLTPHLDRYLLENADYYVIALDAPAAEAVTRSWDTLGVPDELAGFSTYVHRPFAARLECYIVSLPFPLPVPRAKADERLLDLLVRIRNAETDTQLDQRTRSAFNSKEDCTGHLVLHDVDYNSAVEMRVSFWFRDRIGPHEIDLIERALQGWVGGDFPGMRLINRSPEWWEHPKTIYTPRVPPEMYGEIANDRFQTFTGIQYYFDQDFRLVRGHVYFPDSDWGLSAISQSQFWAGRGRRLPRGIRGVLSVDIGGCHALSSHLAKRLVDSKPIDIANEVWRQSEQGLRRTRGPDSVVTELPLPTRRYYHLDSNLEFSGGVLRANRSPFLINIAGDWKNRPRCMPWVPGQSRFVFPARTDSPDVWQASHGGYRIHADKVVFCGHYMRTFTRMTTMEAANESARHAVNAILDHIAEVHGTSGSRGRHPVNSDYCQIWDIEQQELEDMAFFKRVDKMLFDAGKPCIADILQFDKLSDLLHPTLDSGQALATFFADTLARDWGVKAAEAVGGLKGIAEIAQRLAKALGAQYTTGQSPLHRILQAIGFSPPSEGRPDE